jgi:hypothetical protein
LIAALHSDTRCDDARDLIASGLKQLAAANLLEPGSVDLTTLENERSTVSRRAAVVAGISMAVPIMTSILAPTPAAAKSHPEKDGKKDKKEKKDK